MQIGMINTVLIESVRRSGNKDTIPLDIAASFIEILIELYVKHHSLEPLPSTFNTKGKLKFKIEDIENEFVNLKDKKKLFKV